MNVVISREFACPQAMFVNVRGWFVLLGEAKGWRDVLNEWGPEWND